MADLDVTSVYRRPTGELIAMLEDGAYAYQVLPEDDSATAAQARALVEAIEADGDQVPIVDDSAPAPEGPPAPPPPEGPPTAAPLPVVERTVTWGELRAVVEAASTAEGTLYALRFAIDEAIAELEASP